MRKNFLLILCSLLSVVAFAAPITKEQARQAASQFLTSKGGVHRAAAQLAELPPVLNAVDKSGNPYIYAFNAGNNAGYVLVSGDDRFRDVLAYGASGNFDDNNMPAHVKAWLQGYVDEMKYYESIGYQPSAGAVSNSSAASASYRRAVKAPILPLLTTAWDQDEPYNLQCPIFFNSNYGLSVTGCVATAMAQVVYYTAVHSGNQPTTLVRDIPGYTCSTNWSGLGNLEVAGVLADTVTFDWDNMLNVYRSGYYDNVQANAVAKLMACCGKSVRMDYSTSGSGANTLDVVNALITYFGFDTTTKAITRSNYSYAQWIEIVYAELAAGRPVQYGATSSGGGHSFVIDGYDGDEMFHVNWGWSGTPDSYYALSVLNPGDNSGIGASTSNDGYSYNQRAIVGIRYGTGQQGEEVPVMLSTGNLRVNGQQVIFEAFNMTGETHSFHVGIGFMDEEGGITPITSYLVENLKTGSGWYDFYVDVPTDKTKAGQTLKIVPISKESSTNTWYTGCNSDIYYWDAVYDANGVPTLTAHPIYDLSASTISFTGSTFVNEVQPVEVTVTNNGDEYYGILYMFASTTSTKGAPVNKGGVTVQKNKSTIMTFEWTPTTTGTYNIWIATDNEGDNVIGTSSVTISVNNHAPAGPFIYSQLIVENADETSWRTNEDGNLIVDVYSEELNFSSVKVLNATGSSQSANLRFRLYRDVNGSWVFVKGYSASVSANGGSILNFGGMPFYNVGYGTYLLRLESDDVVFDGRYIFNLTMGYNVIAEDGSVVPVKTTSTDVTVDENVAAVDLSNFNFSNITPNSNPNTLYIIGGEQAVPASLSGKNVVQMGVAQQITLTDGHAFYSPVDFTALEISYTRTETTYYDKDTQKGWTTIVLPFVPDGIKTVLNDEDYPLTWFQSAEETNKNLWLMEFYDEHNGIVDFGYAGSMLEANKPYIMALPGDSYGNRWSLEGLPIIFYAENADIMANAKATTTGKNYKFVGTTLQKENLSDIYKLNADGDQFVKGTASIEPFRAYFAPTSSAATAEALSFGFGRGVITNVIEVKGVTDVKETNDNNIYNMNGQRVGQPAKGLYIVNGRKVVIK